MNELAIFNNAITGDLSAYCSRPLTAMSPEEKKNFFNSISGDVAGLKDYINVPLQIKDVYAEPVTITKDETGEVMDSVRIILIDEEGKGYATCSAGVRNTMAKLFAVYGTPDTWAEPITIIPKEKNRGQNRVLVFEIA